MSRIHMQRKEICSVRNRIRTTKTRVRSLSRVQSISHMRVNEELKNMELNLLEIGKR